MQLADTYLNLTQPRRRRGAQAQQAGASGGFGDIYGADGQLNMQGVLSYLDTNWNSARQANESRFKEAGDMAMRSRQEALGYLDGYGASAKGDIDREMTDRLGGLDADLIGRGLYNTTIKDAQGTQIREAAGRQRAAVDERANLLRADASSRGYDQYINLLAQREDQYPDVGSWLGLIQQANALKSERDQRDRQYQRDRDERREMEGKRIVHTRSDPYTGTVTEYYADGSQRTYQIQQQQASGAAAGRIRTGGTYF